MPTTQVKKVTSRVQQKRELETNWVQAENFKPMDGEIIVYKAEDDDTVFVDTDTGKPLLADGRTTPIRSPRLKIGDGESFVNDLDFIAKGLVDNSSLTCNRSGIISLNQEYIDYLDSQLFQYPTVSSFNIVGSNQEVGTTVTITSFKHKETNSKNIDGELTLTSNKNSEIKLSVAPSDTEATVTFSDSYTFASNTTLTYTLTGVDKRGNTITKTDSVSSYYPSFVGALTESSITSQAGLTKIASGSLAGTRSIESFAQYVYFVTTTAIKSIKSGGFDVAYSQLDSITLNINGISKSYYVYRTNETILSTMSYVIA